MEDTQLTEPGIVPTILMGLNTKRLRKNILLHFKSIKQKFLRDSTLKISDLLKKRKFKNIILLSYSSRLNGFLFWLQQLIAESLGKNEKGFLPLISQAPKDHHSLLQLYLSGPKDKIFYIFSEEIHKQNSIKLFTKNFNKNVKFLNNKNLNQIKKAQKISFIKALKSNKTPFREFQIKKINEETLGELFSYFILEISLIGKLSNINPFNQPSVEQVKVNTKNILS